MTSIALRSSMRCAVIVAIAGPGIASAQQTIPVLRYQPPAKLAGSSDHVVALHYYLFAADGHVYRCYDNPPADYQHFDFNQAGQDDPVNSGRYAVSGGQLYMQFGSGQELEEITAPLPRSGRVEIETVVYQRQ